MREDFAFHRDRADSRFRFGVVLPTSLSGRQLISGTTYSTPPDQAYSHDGNDYVYYAIPTGKRSLLDETISISFNAAIPVLDPSHGQDWPQLSDKVNLTSPETMIESDSQEILAIAKKLKVANPISTIRNVHAFVSSVITHEDHNSLLSALQTLHSHKGDCTEYSTLGAAILRACGIPTTIPYGIIVETGEYHTWNEAYIQDYGWLPIDLTSDNYDYFNPKLHYVYFSLNFYNDPNLDYQGFDFWESLTSDGAMRVSPSFTISFETSQDGLH